MTTVFLSYRHVEPDESLAVGLHQAFEAAGVETFIDQQMLVGTRWVEEIERRIRAARFFVVLLSEHSIRSDMVRKEAQLAHSLLDRDPAICILPVRVAFEGELPYDLGAYLDGIQYARWSRNEPVASLAEQLLRAMRNDGALPEPGDRGEGVGSEPSMHLLEEMITERGAPLPAADPRLVRETGSVRPDSPFYLRRPADDVVDRMVTPSSNGWALVDTLIVKGPRQVGKSSLLARAHAQARQSGRSVYLDFQMFDRRHFESLESLHRYLALKVARGLGTRGKPEDLWSEMLGPKDNLTEFLAESALADHGDPVFLVLDEVDKVFEHAHFRDEFFATLRGWHNMRARDERFRRLGLVIGHSTEPALWIQDIHQSPFNVGERIRLLDFDRRQITELNALHGAPLPTHELDQMHHVVGGHPYLLRQSLYTVASGSSTFEKLMETRADETGPFGDHLRRYLWVLRDQKQLRSSLRGVLRGHGCAEEDCFQRLSAAGLIKGETRDEAEPRCQLYADYFGKHL